MRISAKLKATKLAGTEEHTSQLERSPVASVKKLATTRTERGDHTLFKIARKAQPSDSECDRDDVRKPTRRRTEHRPYGAEDHERWHAKSRNEIVFPPPRTDFTKAARNDFRRCQAGGVLIHKDAW